MKQNRFIYSVVLTICISFSLTSFGKAEEGVVLESNQEKTVSQQENTATDWDLAEGGQHVLITGTVHRVGNEPFTVLVITDESDNSWNLDENSAILLSSYEQQKVSVTGTVILKAMTLADGTEMSPQRILTDLILTSPK
jgi:hypothetical protein